MQIDLRRSKMFETEKKNIDIVLYIYTHKNIRKGRKKKESIALDS